MKESIGVYIIGIIGLFVLMPIPVFGAGYFGGVILKTFVGDSLTGGLYVIFGDNIRVDLLPRFCGALAVLGSYFKSYQYNSK